MKAINLGLEGFSYHDLLILYDSALSCNILMYNGQLSDSTFNNVVAMHENDIKEHIYGRICSIVNTAVNYQSEFEDCQKHLKKGVVGSSKYCYAYFYMQCFKPTFNPPLEYFVCRG